MKYEFKGTPAPWRIASKLYRDQFYVIHGIDGTSKSKRELQVLKIDHGYHPIKEQLDMTKHNAHLIAAAPDLLQACIEAWEHINVSYPACEEAVIKVKQAIHKALNIPD